MLNGSYRIRNEISANGFFYRFCEKVLMECWRFNAIESNYALIWYQNYVGWPKHRQRYFCLFIYDYYLMISCCFSFIHFNLWTFFMFKAIQTASLSFNDVKGFWCVCVYCRSEKEIQTSNLAFLATLFLPIENHFHPKWSLTRKLRKITFILWIFASNKNRRATKLRKKKKLICCPSCEKQSIKADELPRHKSEDMD